MDKKEITQLIQRELAQLVKEDEQIRRLVLEIARTEFADKSQTEGRFERMLAELERDRQQNQRWWEETQQELRTLREEQNRKWDENQQELRTLREENQQELRTLREENQQELRTLREENQQELRTLREEQNRKWEEQNRKWEEQNRKWEEQNRKWDENQQTINQMLQSIKTVDRRIDQTIGALGARWGVQTESSFREALKGILTDSFGVIVENVTEFDEQGEVFGRPDQIELDIIIKNGLLIICEVKSSMSKSDMYTFVKKVAFYEKRHQTQANRRLVISPMVDPYAIQVAQDYGLEVYSYPEDVADI